MISATVSYCIVDIKNMPPLVTEIFSQPFN
jgi:hypothetical protein